MSVKRAYIELPDGYFWCPLCESRQSDRNICRHLDTKKHLANVEQWVRGEIRPAPPRDTAQQRPAERLPGQERDAGSPAQLVAHDGFLKWLEIHGPRESVFQQDEQHPQDEVDMLHLESADGPCGSDSGGTRGPKAVPVTEEGLHDEAFNPAFTEAGVSSLSGSKVPEQARVPLPCWESDDEVACESPEGSIAAEFAQLRMQAESDDDCDLGEPVRLFAFTLDICCCRPVLSFQ